jgi:hypothetical protein
MVSLEEIKIYLPKYLSPQSEENLFDQLKQFPENIDDRLYTSYLLEPQLIYQGDGIQGLLVVNLPDPQIRPAPGMILSNTCAIVDSNKRPFPSSLVYAPIFNLEKYQEGLLASKILKDPGQIEDHIHAIKKQRIIQIFYLPKGGALENESIVFLDRVNSCDNSFLSKVEVKDIRLFTLSNYGLYQFIFKLSVHFTRITEGIDRSPHCTPS